MTDAALEHVEMVRRPVRRVLLGSVRELALVPAIAVLFVVGAESLILLTGSFDLSLQSIYGLAPMIGAWLIVSKDAQGLGTKWNPGFGILVVIGIGAAVGLFNGFMIVKLRFTAFIFTLAMLILLAGLQQGIVSGRTIYGMPPSFIYLGGAYWAGFPVSAWVTSAVFLAAALFLRYHRTGRAIYAIGGNLEAARAAGIKIDRVRIGVFCVAGLLASIGGLMTAGQVLTVTANQGNNLIFTVFAAAVIGGIALEGGRGRMVGAFTGVVLLGMTNEVLVLRNTPTSWSDAVTGATILLPLVLA